MDIKLNPFYRGSATLVLVMFVLSMVHCSIPHGVERHYESIAIHGQYLPPSSPQRASGPDLEISSNNISVYPDPIKAGDTGFIAAEVHNIGPEAASFINVTFTVNSVPLGSPVIVPLMMGNSQDNVTKMWQPSTPGNYSLGIILDEGNSIQEMNEGNNEAAIEVFVATEINVPPGVNITHPGEYDRVDGTVMVTGTAHDSPMDMNELASVEVKIDNGGWKEVSGLQAWQYEWDTTTFSEGLHNITARAYDGEDYSSNHMVNVIVNNDVSNLAPVAVITSPSGSPSSLRFSVNETIFFQGNESYDTDEGPGELNYTWNMGDGLFLYGANVNYSYKAKSPLVSVILRVYDGDMEDSASIHIVIDNIPPVAVAGEDRTAEIGEVITLDGSESYDPDGQYISEYAWDLGNGDMRYGSVVNYTYTEGGGSFEVVLTVYDSRNESDNDSLIVTLNNTLPVAVLDIPSHTVSANADLYFDGSSSYDPDGEVTEYYFDFGDGHSTGWTASADSNHTYTVAGQYAPRLKVKDSMGGISLWNSMDITVLASPNQIPTVEITAPLADSVVASPLIVEGKSSDPDAADVVKRIEVTIGNIKVFAESISENAYGEWRAEFEDIGSLPNGPAEIKALAFDGKDYSTPAKVDVSVNNDEPESIIIEMIEVTSKVFPGERVEMKGQAKYDTGVTAAEAAVTLELFGESYPASTDGNGFFYYSVVAPRESGEFPGEIEVEKDLISGKTEVIIGIYEVDFSLDESSVKLFRDDEEIIGFNDAARDGETVELRITVIFFSGAAEGHSFTGYVNISESSGDKNTLLVEKESVSFTPDGNEQNMVIKKQWTPVEGSSTITVQVEAHPDTSPENNNVTRKFTIREKITLADFTVTDMKLSEGEIREGKAVSVSITITNRGNESGFVNVSLYRNSEESGNLIGQKKTILLKPGATQTIPINWMPKRGYVTLVAVVDSSMEELDKENNRLSESVKVLPAENNDRDNSSSVITVTVIGIILVLAAATWVYYRRKEAEDMEDHENEDDERFEVEVVMDNEGED